MLLLGNPTSFAVEIGPVTITQEVQTQEQAERSCKGNNYRTSFEVLFLFLAIPFNSGHHESIQHQERWLLNNSFVMSSLFL